LRKSSNFHESFAAGEVSPPSPRGTGLVFAGVALLFALLRRHDLWVALPAVGVAALLVIVSLTVPRLLQPLNILWFRFGLLLHKVVNPIVMFAVFAVVFVPAGALMRIWQDPLRLRRDPQATTYWLPCDGSENANNSMRNQF
jgi:hypothetical protein